MDVLSDVLKAIRLTGAIFFERHLHAPWVGESPPSAAIASMVMPDAEHVISFHAILSGSCWAGLVASSDSSRRFNAGDIVIYPMGDANVLSSAPGMRGLPDLQEYARPKDQPLPIVTRLNKQGADYCHLVCGYFGCAAISGVMRDRSIHFSKRCLACFSAKCLLWHRAGSPTCFAWLPKRPDAAALEAKVCWPNLPS
jgi:hypothetical protein